MKLQLAELTLDRKEGNEETMLARLKVSVLTSCPCSSIDRYRIYVHFYTSIERLAP